MAEHAETVEFWKGIVIGTMFGLVAAAYARGDLRRLFTVAVNSNSPIDSPKTGFRDHAPEIDLRRESAENAGDPTRLSPATPGIPAARPILMERLGGAPGPSSVPEVLEVPGHHGQLIDHSDAAQSVHSAARTHKIS